MVRVSHGSGMATGKEPTILILKYYYIKSGYLTILGDGIMFYVFLYYPKQKIYL